MQKIEYVSVILESNFLSFFPQISNEKYKIIMNPVDILNALGEHGYRVIGFTAEADKKMVWTLEKKKFSDGNTEWVF